MSHSSKLFTGGIALLLISASGCAGNGLKSMFSRNETDGYKTLEELEAENAKAAERDSAVAEADGETDGPRFAPWLPFGKKSTEGTDAVAANKAQSSDSAETVTTESDTTVAWWKNPFRRREPVELDPFLTQDELPGTSVAQSEKEVATSAEAAVAADREPSFVATVQPEKSVKAVSRQGGTMGLSNEDELLVEKFEEHFQKNTVETADASEPAHPLIIAGETTRTVQAKSASSATDKLAELERLLEDKRSSATGRNSSQPSFAEESPELVHASGEFSETLNGRRSTAKTQTGATRTRMNRAVDSFDSLLAASPSDVSSKTRPNPGNRNGSGDPGDEAADSTRVDVANADSLFGAAAAVSAAKETRESFVKAAAGGWSDTSGDGGFHWMQADRSGSQNRQERDGGATRQETEGSAIHTAALRSGNKVPVASLPETPDFNSPFPTGAAAAPGRRTGIPDAATTRTVSASRELQSPSAARDLADDSFFATATSASGLNDLSASPTLTTEATMTESTPSAVTSVGSNSSTLFKGRHVLLLLGGIIVVALLFAPGRKKPIQANHAPVGG